MERPSWIAPLYGYVVCVVAVITFIVSLSGFVDAAFERAYPLQSRGGAYGPGGESLTSYESYRATSLERAKAARGPQATPADTLSTAEMRARYETLRAERIEQGRFFASQRLVKTGLLMLVAIGLFVTHWRWVRRLKESGA
jgi:hypothetical protein